MKKLLVVVLLFSLIAATAVSAQSSTKYNGYEVVNVKVNGSALNLDVPAIIMDGRTLLPLRKVAEAMNSIIIWDAAAKTASVVKPQVNIVFTETKDDVNALGNPIETIPYWTEYETFLSYVTVSNLPAGDYSLLCSIYRNNPETGLTDSVPIDSKPLQNISVSGPNTPVPFSLSWDKAVITDAGVYSFVVSIKDSSGKYQPVAVHTMEIR